MNTKWDLVQLNWSRRDPLREDSDRENLHHTLYVSDDYIQTEYDKGIDLPGLCHPCDCRELSEEELKQKEKEEEAEYENMKHKERDEKPNVFKGPFSPEDVGRDRKYQLLKLKGDMRKLGRRRTYPDEHYDYYHAGGNVVFNRRRLEDVPDFIQNLDRFWVDWVSALSIAVLRAWLGL